MGGRVDRVTRGDVVSIALQGDFGKPRPALVIQSSLFDEHTTTTVLPITSATVDAPLLRVSVSPSDANGLSKLSQIMIDKATTVLRDKVGPAFGRIDDSTMIEVDRRLAVFLGIAK